MRMRCWIYMMLVSDCLFSFFLFLLPFAFGLCFPRCNLMCTYISISKTYKTLLTEFTFSTHDDVIHRCGIDINTY